ncbi:hypothetical protein JHK87_052831 [Glycine soja]|nr:hypothetical protein JHK87_052831 [Glycine soja]
MECFGETGTLSRRQPSIAVRFLCRRIKTEWSASKSIEPLNRHYCFLYLLHTRYVQSNIKVVENHSEYKVSNIPFLVYFVKTTFVKEAERPEILLGVHVITPFTDIIVGATPRDTLVDIIGVVVEVIKRKTINPTYRFTVKLRDNSDGEMMMIVWEEYVLQLDDAIEKNHIDRKPLVVMLTLAKIKDPKVFLNPNRASIPNEALGTSSCIMLKWFHLSFVPQPSHSHGSKSGDGVKVFPPCVEELLGKTWVLRFKYRVQIHQSSVLDVTEDEDIIHTINSTISLQDEPSIGKGKDVAAKTSSPDFHPTIVFFITNFHAESP